MSSLFEYCFEATIKRSGVQRYVLLPEDISASFNGKKYVPVIVALDEHQKPAKKTLMPAGNNSFKLFLNVQQRKPSGADTGDKVFVFLSRDQESRVLPVPIELNEELEFYPLVKNYFFSKTINQRREIISYLDDAKKAETRLRRAKKIVAILLKEISEKS